MTPPPRPVGRRWAGLAVGGSAWALALAALALVAVAERPFSPAVTWADDPDFFAFHLLVALTSGTGSALVLARTRHAAGPVCALLAVLFAAAPAALGWSFLADERGWPGVGLSAHAASWLAAPGGFLAVAVLPWFLRPARPGRAPLALAGVGALGTATITVAGIGMQQPGAPANPLALGGTPVGTVLDHLVWPAAGACGVVGLLAVGDVVRRWRSAPPDDARAYGALALAVSLMFAAMGVLPLGPPALVDAAMLPLVAISQVLMVLAVLALTLRTWDAGAGAGTVVPRVAVWSLLSAVVVVLYVGLVSALGRLLPGGDQVAGATVIALLAVLVDPLRRLLQRRVDLLVHGGGADPVALLARLGADLRRPGDRDALRGLVDELRDSLRLGWVEVAAVGEPEVRVAAGRERAHPRPAETASYPLVVDGRHLGDLHTQAVPGERIEPRVRRAVRRLADVVAVTLDLTQTTLRLRAASDRLGQVRDEERRLLRRELHDGMGPVLAGVGLGLAAAQRRLRHDPDAADRLLDELRTEVARRSDGVRLLARSLLPAELDEGDLGGAMRVLAARFAASGLVIETTASGLGDVDPRRQVAVYHVAGEALLNAYRHAGASRVRLRVTSGHAGSVVLDVVDDGRGIAPDHRCGIGLVSMRERAAELSGSVWIGPGPDDRGTRVRLVLP